MNGKVSGCLSGSVSAPGRRDLGQSLTELALVLPVLLLFSIGIVDLSRIMFAYITVVNAANAGAQYASTSRITAADTSGIVTAATQDTTSLATAPTVTVSGPSDDGRGDGYQQVTVTVNYSFTLAFPAPAGLGPSIPISHSATMRVTPRT